MKRDGQRLRQRTEGLGPRGQREVERFADAADFMQLQAARRPFGLDLKLPVNPQRRLDLLARVLRNQELAAGGEGFNAPGEVHVRAHRGVFRPAQRADVADDHPAGVDADAHFEFGSALAP